MDRINVNASELAIPIGGTLRIGSYSHGGFDKLSVAVIEGDAEGLEALAVACLDVAARLKERDGYHMHLDAGTLTMESSDTTIQGLPSDRPAQPG